MIIRTLFILYVLVLFQPSITAGYDDQITHPAITEKAATSDVSNLNDYLKTSLGFEQGFDSRFPSNSQDPKKSALELLKTGSTDEDSPACRASNHFHDPLETWDQSGMSDEPLWLDIKCFSWAPWYSNITWATGYLSPPPGEQKQIFTTNPDYAPINWDTARDSYYKALTSTTNLQPPFPQGRDYYFAKTFQSLGHVLHLLEDMAVPAHVRNDFTSHVAFNGITSSDFVKWFGNHYEYYVQTHNNIVTSISEVEYPSFTNNRLTDFWDTDQYNGDNPSSGLTIGLAEFTNANYLSDSTIPYTLRMPYHMYTYPKIDDPNIQICIDYEPGSTDKRVYLSRKNRGACPPITEERLADHFAALGFWNDFSVNTIIDAVLNLDFTVLATPVSLDDNVHKTYANDLLPRAVGYSAGLLNYFFRGTLEITPPAQVAYAFTDGSITPYFDEPSGNYHQQFRSIKAKVRNITIKEELPDGTKIYEDIQAGIIQAVAKYKIIPNYMYDLSNYPPDGNVMKDVGYSYSASLPITITSLSSTEATEFTFDFTSNPIPAGITDLYLQVIFKGTLGNETDIAIAVGIKDLMEPTHQVFWNATDMFKLDGHLYLSDTIKADTELADRVDIDGDGIFNETGEPYIDPHPVTFGIGYLNGPPGPANPFTYSAITALQSGKHIRVIALFDKAVDNYMALEKDDNIDTDAQYFHFAFPGVVNQEENGVWQMPTPITTFRHDIDGRPIRQHFKTAFFRCYPVEGTDPDGNPVCVYSESEAIPAELLPSTIDTVYFP
jgi:hypothetical protein